MLRREPITIGLRSGWGTGAGNVRRRVPRRRSTPVRPDKQRVTFGCATLVNTFTRRVGGGWLGPAESQPTWPQPGGRIQARRTRHDFGHHACRNDSHRVRGPRRALCATSRATTASSGSTSSVAGRRAPCTCPPGATSSSATSPTIASCAGTRPRGAIGVFRQPAGYANGNTLDRRRAAGHVRARQSPGDAHRARRHDHRPRRSATMAAG